MSELQKKNINCRICLRYDLNKAQKCFSLFEQHNSALISEKIKYIANIEINAGDGLPGKICPDCLLQLETAVVFKQKCETSNKILQSIVQKPLKICKITFRVKEELGIELDGTPEGFIEYSDPEPQIIKHESEREQETQLKESEYEQPLYEEPIDSADDGLKKSRAIDLKLICDDCGNSFKSKCKLAVHWKKVHLPSRLICPRCKRTFKSFKAYHVHDKKMTRSCLTATKVHVEGQGKSRVFQCKECPYKTKHIKDMDAHLVTHSGLRRFQCKDCFKCFTQHSSLQGHRESHHKDYRIETTCHFCGKLIKGRAKYYKHLKIHQPQMVQCEVCKKMLKSQANLANHMKRHSGIRSYTCEICSANFYTPAELCNHRKRVHFKTKTFKCDMCEYSSYTASLLKTHRSRHTLNNVVCLMCGIFVENAEKLAAHQKRHIEKRFSCPHCSKGFFLKDSVRRHVIKKHMTTSKKEIEKETPIDIKQECNTENKFEDVRPLSPTLIS